MVEVLGERIDSGTYLGFVTCITLFMFIFIMRSFDRELRNRFTVITVFLLVGLIAGLIDDNLAMRPSPVSFRYVTTMVRRIVEGCLQIGVLNIITYNTKRRISKWAWVPFLVTSLVILTAPFNSDVFYFSESNQLVNGPLGIIVHLQALIYLVVTVRLCILKWFDGYKQDSFIIIFIVLVALIGATLEKSEVFSNCTLASCSIGMLFLYMFIYAQRYNVDSVSKCYKRRCFYADAEKYAKCKLAIISMDLNDLKYINDNYGHKAGDVALLTFAQVVREVKTNNYILYRTGGDEFMILGIKVSKKEAEELVEMIREKLKETPYSCSFGINMYNPGDDFDGAVVKADKAMYEDKAIYKSSNRRRSFLRTELYDEKIQEFTNNISFLS